MRHRILTCRKHLTLRWSCKDIAWDSGYNGCRHLFFNGIPSGKGMYSDSSGLDCTMIRPQTQYSIHQDISRIVEECNCPASDLILAPEDSLVKI